MALRRKDRVFPGLLSIFTRWITITFFLSKNLSPGSSPVSGVSALKLLRRVLGGSYTSLQKKTPPPLIQTNLNHDCSDEVRVDQDGDCCNNRGNTSCASSTSAGDSTITRSDSAITQSDNVVNDGGNFINVAASSPRKNTGSANKVADESDFDNRHGSRDNQNEAIIATGPAGLCSTTGSPSAANLCSRLSPKAVALMKLTGAIVEKSMKCSNMCFYRGKSKSPCGGSGNKLDNTDSEVSGSSDREETALLKGDSSRGNNSKITLRSDSSASTGDGIISTTTGDNDDTIDLITSDACSNHDGKSQTNTVSNFKGLTKEPPKTELRSRRTGGHFLQQQSPPTLNPTVEIDDTLLVEPFSGGRKQEDQKGYEVRDQGDEITTSRMKDNRLPKSKSGASRVAFQEGNEEGSEIDTDGEKSNTSSQDPFSDWHMLSQELADPFLSQGGPFLSQGGQRDDTVRNGGTRNLEDATSHSSPEDVVMLDEASNTTHEMNTNGTEATASLGNDTANSDSRSMVEAVLPVHIESVPEKVLASDKERNSNSNLQAHAGGEQNFDSNLKNIEPKNIPDTNFPASASNSDEGQMFDDISNGFVFLSVADAKKDGLAVVTDGVSVVTDGVSVVREGVTDGAFDSQMESETDKKTKNADVVFGGTGFSNARQISDGIEKKEFETVGEGFEPEDLKVGI